MIVVFLSDEHRREEYLYLEELQRQWARTQDKAKRKALLLSFLRDHLRWQCRANAGLWTLVEVLFLELVKTRRLWVGHDQQLADLEKEGPEDESADHVA